MCLYNSLGPVATPALYNVVLLNPHHLARNHVPVFCNANIPALESAVLVSRVVCTKVVVHHVSAPSRVAMLAKSRAQKAALLVKRAARTGASIVNVRNVVENLARDVKSLVSGNVSITTAPCCAPNLATALPAMNPVQSYLSAFIHALVFAESHVLNCAEYVIASKSPRYCLEQRTMKTHSSWNWKIAAMFWKYLVWIDG